MSRFPNSSESFEGMLFRLLNINAALVCRLNNPTPPASPVLLVRNMLFRLLNVDVQFPNSHQHVLQSNFQNCSCGARRGSLCFGQSLLATSTTSILVRDMLFLLKVDVATVRQHAFRQTQLVQAETCADSFGETEKRIRQCVSLNPPPPPRVASKKDRPIANYIFSSNSPITEHCPMVHVNGRT